MARPGIGIRGTSAFFAPEKCDSSLAEKREREREIEQKKIYIELCQWPFQDPNLEVPTIYKAYIRPM